jgi:hemolysin activation/secretion protein
MKTLGGNQTLRGYRQMRFSDRNLIYLSGEYRWEAMPAMELAVFYDTGKVASRRSDLNLDHLRHTFGGGLRFKSMRRVVVRIDIGRSDEQTFLFFTFGPSF